MARDRKGVVGKADHRMLGRHYDWPGRCGRKIRRQQLAEGKEFEIESRLFWFGWAPENGNGVGLTGYLTVCQGLKVLSNEVRSNEVRRRNNLLR